MRGLLTVRYLPPVLHPIVEAWRNATLMRLAYTSGTSISFWSGHMGTA